MAHALKAKILTVEDLESIGKSLTVPPETLSPTDENVASIKKGAYLKIGLTTHEFPNAPIEYCWMEFIQMWGDTWQGSINNDLRYSAIHGYKDGSELVLERDQILAILY